MLNEPHLSTLLRRSCEPLKAPACDTRQQRAELWLLYELEVIEARDAAIASDIAGMRAVTGTDLPASGGAPSENVLLLASLQELAIHPS